MKHLSAILVFFCCIFCAAHSNAATISGAIKSVSTGSAVVGATVYIHDTTVSPHYHDSTITNSTGDYSFTLPSRVASGDLILLNANAGCGVAYYEFIYNGGQYAAS